MKPTSFSADGDRFPAWKMRFGVNAEKKFDRGLDFNPPNSYSPEAMQTISVAEHSTPCRPEIVARMEQITRELESCSDEELAILDARAKAMIESNRVKAGGNE